MSIVQGFIRCSGYLCAGAFFGHSACIIIDKYELTERREVALTKTRLLKFSGPQS